VSLSTGDEVPHIFTRKSRGAIPRAYSADSGKLTSWPARLGHGAYDLVSGHPRNFFVAPQFVKALTHLAGLPVLGLTRDDGGLGST
jgi:hypothetical protein